MSENRMRKSGAVSLLASLSILAGCAGNQSGSTPVVSSSTQSTLASQSPLAYVFTPDGNQYVANAGPNTTEFSLAPGGRLQPVATGLPFLPLAGTTSGLVGSPAGNTSFQSYAVQADGSLVAEGSPVPSSNYSASASTGADFYAVSDTAIYGFADGNSGLSALPPMQKPVPLTCVPGNIDGAQCVYDAWMTIGDTSAYLLEEFQYFGPPLYQLTSFSRQGAQLVSQTLVPVGLTTGLIAITPNGKFIYSLDLASSRIYFYNVKATNYPEYNVLSNGNQLQASGYNQFMVSTDGAYLVAAATPTPAAASVIHMFQINSSSGVLTEVPGSPFSTGQAGFITMSFDPTGQFLLVASCTRNSAGYCTTGNLAAMSYDSSSGALSVTSDVADGTYPYSVTAAPVSQ